MMEDGAFLEWLSSLFTESFGASGRGMEWDGSMTLCKRGFDEEFLIRRIFKHSQSFTSGGFPAQIYSWLEKGIRHVI